jgi:hypothetical protein
MLLGRLDIGRASADPQHQITNRRFTRHKEPMQADNEGNDQCLGRTGG